MEVFLSCDVCFLENSEIMLVSVIKTVKVVFHKAVTSNTTSTGSLVCVYVLFTLFPIACMPLVVPSRDS